VAVIVVVAAAVVMAVVTETKIGKVYGGLTDTLLQQVHSFWIFKENYMRVLNNVPRPNWEAQCDRDGFSFYEAQNASGTVAKYWEETRHYEFTQDEADTIASASTELHAMVLNTIDIIVQKGDYERFALVPGMASLIEESWKRGDPYLYGRFDLAFMGDKSTPKLIEYNADSTTLLVESAIAQKRWAEQQYKPLQQFNTIEQDLVDRFSYLMNTKNIDTLAFIGCKPHPDNGNNHEEWDTTQYMASLASKAGMSAMLYDLSDIALDGENFTAFETNGLKLPAIFKLYPWSKFMYDLPAEVYLPNELDATSSEKPFSNTTFFEPAWKALNSKALLPYLWENNQNHPNLLETHFVEPDSNGNWPEVTNGWVRKPIYGRAGEGIVLMAEDGNKEVTGQGYDGDGYIDQQYTQLFRKYGSSVIVGSWMIGEKTSGIGLREDAGYITTEDCLFVPHSVK
jgi:glutathionylspermidine synthase